MCYGIFACFCFFISPITFTSPVRCISSSPESQLFSPSAILREIHDPANAHKASFFVPIDEHATAAINKDANSTVLKKKANNPLKQALTPSVTNTNQAKTPHHNRTNSKKLIPSTVQAKSNSTNNGFNSTRKVPGSSNKSYVSSSSLMTFHSSADLDHIDWEHTAAEVGDDILDNDTNIIVQSCNSYKETNIIKSEEWNKQAQWILSLRRVYTHRSTTLLPYISTIMKIVTQIGESARSGLSKTGIRCLTELFTLSAYTSAISKCMGPTILSLLKVRSDNNLKFLQDPAHEAIMTAITKVHAGKTLTCLLKSWESKNKNQRLYSSTYMVECLKHIKANTIACTDIPNLSMPVFLFVVISLVTENVILI